MLKKVLTVFLSAILLFNLSACAEKETDVSKINNELLNPCRSTFAVLEETNFLNDLLHDLQWVDISLDGWSATEDLTEKFKKSTFKNGIYTLSSSFNYTIGDSYLVITDEHFVYFVYSLFENRKEITVFDSEYGRMASYVEYVTDNSILIEYDLEETETQDEHSYHIELYNDGGYSILHLHDVGDAWGSPVPIKEVFDENGLLRSVEFKHNEQDDDENVIKATRLIGKYSVDPTDLRYLVDSLGNRVMDGESYMYFQYQLRGVSIADSPWLIIQEQ